MALRANYLCFTVSDMARALAFYRTLGLPIPADQESTPLHVEIELGGVRIAWETDVLRRDLDPQWAPLSRDGRLSIALQADSPAEVDAAVERIRAAGHLIEHEPFDAVWGQRYATVIDPDGTCVDLYAWQPAPTRS